MPVRGGSGAVWMARLSRPDESSSACSGWPAGPGHGRSGSVRRGGARAVAVATLVAALSLGPAGAAHAEVTSVDRSGTGVPVSGSVLGAPVALAAHRQS